MIDRIKNAVRAIMRQMAIVLNRLSGGTLTPNAVTFIGVIMHVPIALLIATQHNYWAAALLLVFGLFDTLDGELARLQKRETPSGVFLDSSTDRIKEIMVYTGAAYAIIASTHRPYLAVWAVAAVGSSLLTSYINAQGDSVMLRFYGAKHAANKAFRGGLLPFEIRMFILLVGLLSNRLALAVAVITVGAAYTALSRLVRVFRKLTEADA